MFLVCSSSVFAESYFTAKGCEYSVAFPSPPEYKTGFDPNIGEYTQAEFKAENNRLF